jgi:hypothetical protein
MNMTDYLTSNYLKAADLKPGVLIEAKIVSVRPVDFEDGTTKPVIYTDYMGKGIVLNQTRLKALIAAWGPNPDNLIGKTIIISQGRTMYAGEEVDAVVIKPVVADRIATHGATVAAIGNRREPLKQSVAPPIDRVPDGLGPIDDDIPS